ncbi:MAG: hypothetical protein WAX44_03335 [Minisyncoccia bacterium]
MNTTYKQHIVSPFQVKKKTYDISGKDHPVQEEIRKNLGELHLTAVFEEDTQTLQAFRHVSGVIAFLCTLKKDDQIIGFGRGVSVVTKLNRYVERTVSFAQNSALIDSVVRATKMLDALHLSSSGQQNTVITKDNEDFSPITTKQKNYLLKLLQTTNIINQNSRDQMEDEIDGMSKEEAAEKISFLIESR